MTTKRMRVFAGPNGSGKTTIFRGILNERKINLGVYVNADEIEVQLAGSQQLPFTPFGIQPDEESIKAFFRASRFAPQKRKESDLWQKLSVQNNTLYVQTNIDSYLSADLAEFIRQHLLAKGISFTYETVMSHPNKVAFMKSALLAGYRVYLYYIATEDPEININRVNVRVEQKGHTVAPEIIRQRYFRSLELLKDAVRNSNRTFIFDNSGSVSQFIAEIVDGSEVRLNKAVDVPVWVANYLFNK